MGQYLGVGIPTKISIRRRDIISKEVDLESIQRGLQEMLDLSSYDLLADTDQGYLWQIKPELFDTNFKEFYAKLMQAYYPKLDNKEKIALISESDASGQALLDMARNNVSYNFYTITDTFSIIDLHDINGNKIYNGYNNGLSIYLEFLVFFAQGKIIMECYNELFKFFENNIRQQYSQYPISKCIKVLIFG